MVLLSMLLLNSQQLMQTHVAEAAVEKVAY
jgi:hypothetical protein